MLKDGKERNGSLAEMLETLVSESDGDTISIRQILEIVGTAAYGPLLIIPSLVALAPTGAIPGMSVLTGSIIFLVSVQMLISERTVWLPEKILKFEFCRAKLVRAIKKMTPYVAKLDRVLKSRLSILVRPPSTYFIASICLLLAITMYPLALIPFAVAIPAMAVLLFGVGLTTRDGFVILIGFLVTITAVYFAWHAFGTVS